jgi:RNA polymerase-binding protein DksA
VKKKTSSKQNKKGTGKAIETRQTTKRSHIAKQSEKIMPKTQLSKKELDEFKEMLLTIRERLVGKISSVKADALVKTEDINDGEDGTEMFTREFMLQLAGSDNEALHEIDDALQRIEEKTYGICETCFQPIGKERLKALPFTRECIKCKSMKEKGIVPLPRL